MRLLVIGVSAVVHPFDGDSLGPESGLVKIVVRGGTGQVAVGTGLSAQAHQALVAVAAKVELARVADRGRDAKQSADRADQADVDLAETTHVAQLMEQRLQGIGTILDVACLGVVLPEGAPVLAKTAGLGNLGLLDGLLKAALPYRHRQPSFPLGGLDLVAVAPVVLGVLDAVVYDELIHRGNDVEIALPRDVVGLQDCHTLHVGL